MWAGKLSVGVMRVEGIIALTVKVGLLMADEVTDSTTEPTDELASAARELADEAASATPSWACAMAA